MDKRGSHDLAAHHALNPVDAALVRVDRLEAVPDALARLARLVANCRHIRPITIRRIAAEHTRTLLTLSDVLARRHTVPGTTAPALLGVPTDLRGHANTLAAVRTAARDLYSTADDAPHVTQQLYAIRRRLRAENRRMTRCLTDPDLHTVVASLRPALWIAPALRFAIIRQLNAGAWLHRARDGSWQPATTTSTPRVADAALAARESGLRLIGSLSNPPPPPTAGHTQRSRHHDRAPAPHSLSAATDREAYGVQLA